MAEFGFYQENKEKNLLRSVTGWLMDILAVVALAVFLVDGLGGSVLVSGRSMEPTLSAGDTVLVDTLSYRFFDISRYDVVQFCVEEDGRTNIKRVVGLPGETVQIYDGYLWINGEQAELPEGVSEVTIAGLAADPVTLGENEYFLLGDNGQTSEDSRFSNVGNVTGDKITGRVWFRIRPVERIGFLH